MRLLILIVIGLMFFLQTTVGSTLHNDDENIAVRTSTQVSEPAQQNETMLQVGEELEYSVHYSFFNIGSIHFKVTDKEERDGKVIYHACAIMDSNPSLNWLKELHVRFYSEIDQDAFTHKWISEDSTSKKITYRKMRFDYEAHKMYYEWGDKLGPNEYKVNGERTINIADNCQDGLSLFYYARQHSSEKKQTKIPTYIDTNEVTTNINFGIERLEEDLDAVNYPVDVMKLDGIANFVGVFGLTGGFEGVFSNDAAGIPITARLKVFLGSVKVELKKWKRDNWIPPKAVSEK